MVALSLHGPKDELLQMGLGVEVGVKRSKLNSPVDDFFTRAG